MRINILSLGKFKLNQQHEKIFEYYRKRIKVRINLVELKTYNSNKKGQLEKKEILKYLNKDDSVIVLDQCGENLSSMKFSEILKDKIESGCKKLNFVIGSELGLDDYFKKSFQSIAFGNQTWPHLLVRVMLIEQIYRSFEIIKNSSYHR